MYFCLNEILSSCLIKGELSDPPVVDHRGHTGVAGVELGQVKLHVNPDQRNRDDQTKELHHLLVTSQESDQSDHVVESWVLSLVSANCSVGIAA